MQEGGVCPGECLPDPPPVDRMTDACGNITFPQLLLRTVKLFCVYVARKKENTVCAFNTSVGVLREVTQRSNGLSGLLSAVLQVSYITAWGMAFTLAWCAAMTLVLNGLMNINDVDTRQYILDFHFFLGLNLIFVTLWVNIGIILLISDKLRNGNLIS